MKAYVSLVVLSIASAVTAAVDVYDFRMMVQVPRIYDNMESMGCRKWQSQLIYGQMVVDYGEGGYSPVVTFTNCYNSTHKIDGENVTYSCVNGYDEVVRRWVVMGSNRTGSFKDGSCFFYADFEPSYNVGSDEPDNSLLLYFCGRGQLRKTRLSGKEVVGKVTRWSGYCIGTMGCGCRAYGHVSPTRTLEFSGPSRTVSDVAAIPRGVWCATYRYSY